MNGARDKNNGLVTFPDGHWAGDIYHCHVHARYQLPKKLTLYKYFALALAKALLNPSAYRWRWWRASYPFLPCPCGRINGV